MKKILVLTLFLLLVSITGCVSTEKEADDSPEKQIPITEALELVEELLPEVATECTSRYEEEQFLTINLGMYFHDGWIYYDKGGEFRKCRLDLTEDMSVYPIVNTSEEPIRARYFEVLNQEGIATMTGYPGGNTLYTLDVHTGKTERIAGLNLNRMLYRMVYKDRLIVVQEMTIPGYGAATQLDLYDLQGNFIETIAPSVGWCFAAIDDAIYYLPYYGNPERTMPGTVIMRHDITSGETDVFFEFDFPPEYTEVNDTWSYADFSGRTIVVSSAGYYIYTSIDEIDPKKLVHDDIDRGDSFQFINSTDEGLFFISRYFCEVGDEKGVDGLLVPGPNGDSVFLKSKFFRIPYGTSEPILIKETDKPFFCDMYFSDGYLYYFDDYALKREKFY